jgi:hypothetical protein
LNQQESKEDTVPYVAKAITNLVMLEITNPQAVAQFKRQAEIQLPKLPGRYKTGPRSEWTLTPQGTWRDNDRNELPREFNWWLVSRGLNFQRVS